MLNWLWVRGRDPPLRVRIRLALGLEIGLSTVILVEPFWPLQEPFWLLQTWAVFVPRGAKTEHKGCFITSRAISGHLFSAVLAKYKAKLRQSSKKNCLFSLGDGLNRGQNRTQVLFYYLRGYIGCQNSPIRKGLFQSKKRLKKDQNRAKIGPILWGPKQPLLKWGPPQGSKSWSNVHRIQQMVICFLWFTFECRLWVPVLHHIPCEIW